MVAVKVSTAPAVRVRIGGNTGAKVKAEGTRILVGKADDYKGEYEVTPLIGEDVVLDTANKLMHDDVKVHEVPLFRTSNESGTTLYIGRK